MFVLGIQGSPRKKGNTEYLLSAFLRECRSRGARTETIRPHLLDINPCRELIVCETKGVCPIQDQMEEQGYRKIRQADAVVLATPVFFYGVSAQAKVFIDRCQMFWGRKYKLRLKDPDRHHRRGFLLSVAASGGRRLFDGVDLTARYFFDAVSAEYSGALTYKKVEAAGDMAHLSGLDRDISDAVTRLLTPLQDRPRLIFASPGTGNRALTAAALAKEAARGGIQVVAAAAAPAEVPGPDVVRVLADEGLDVKYTTVRRQDDMFKDLTPGDRVILIGDEETRTDTGPGPERSVVWKITGAGKARSHETVTREISGKIKSLAYGPEDPF